MTFMKFEDFNHDQELRDSRLITPDWDVRYGEYLGGTKHFEGMDYQTLQWMVDNRFADPEDYQNNSPTIAEFLTFLKEHTNFRAIGYVVDIDRHDYRLSVEGITGTDLNIDDILDFCNFVHDANVFEVSLQFARAWYD